MRTIGALCAASALLAASPASATITQIVGGPGGQEFELRCPPDSMAVGLNANAGAWVDGFALLCSSNRRGKREATTRVGGAASSEQEVYCPRGQGIRALYTNFTNGDGLERQYLNSVELVCADLSTACLESGEGCGIISGGIGFAIAPSSRYPDMLVCPEDEVLVGMVGRSGKYVDAVGAICGPRPGMVRLGSASAGDRPPPEDPWKDVGSEQVGDELAGRPTLSALPTSPNPEPDAQLSVPVSTTPATTSVVEGMERNTPPPAVPPR